MSKENPYSLPFTQAQLDTLIDQGLGMYFDIGLQLIDADNNVRPFRDPVEAVLMIGGFDLTDTMNALNMAVNKAIDYLHPYEHLASELRRAIDNVGYFTKGYDIGWHINNGSRDSLEFKDWHAVIKIKQIVYPAIAVIHIKGRDLAAIEGRSNVST